MGHASADYTWWLSHHLLYLFGFRNIVGGHRGGRAFGRTRDRVRGFGYAGIWWRGYLDCGNRRLWFGCTGLRDTILRGPCGGPYAVGCSLSCRARTRGIDPSRFLQGYRRGLRRCLDEMQRLTVDETDLSEPMKGLIDHPDSSTL